MNFIGEPAYFLTSMQQLGMFLNFIGAPSYFLTSMQHLGMFCFDDAILYVNDF